MLERGLLIRHDRGVRVAMQCDGDVTYFDATNPEARKFKVKKNYYERGIKVFGWTRRSPSILSMTLTSTATTPAATCKLGTSSRRSTRADSTRDASRRPDEHCESAATCMGWESAIWDAGLERRHRLVVELVLESAVGGLEHGSRGHSVVDD